MQLTCVCNSKANSLLLQKNRMSPEEQADAEQLHRAIQNDRGLIDCSVCRIRAPGKIPVLLAEVPERCERSIGPGMAPILAKRHGVAVVTLAI